MLWLRTGHGHFGTMLVPKILLYTICACLEVHFFTKILDLKKLVHNLRQDAGLFENSDPNPDKNRLDSQY
jgi:hypothetical protein